MDQTELLRLARIGAEARIAEIQRELDRIRTQFLGDGRGSPGQKRGRRKTAGAGGAPVRRKRKISAAARKRIGDAARRRWAKWRKERADK